MKTHSEKNVNKCDDKGKPSLHCIKNVPTILQHYALVGKNDWLTLSVTKNGWFRLIYTQLSHF